MVGVPPEQFPAVVTLTDNSMYVFAKALDDLGLGRCMD